MVEAIANRTQQLASETSSASTIAGVGDFLGGALKGDVAIASLAAPGVGAAATVGLDALGAIH